MSDAPELILRNGRISTLDRAAPEVSAMAIRNGVVAATGDDATIMPMAGSDT